jgi:hypothetical protein
MKTTLLHVTLVVFCLYSAEALGGQTIASNGAHAPDPDSGISGHVDGLFIPLVTGQPFHARIPVEIKRQLPDGTTVSQKYYTLVARDGTGREYREARDLVAADSDREPPVMRTIVYDPKTSLITTCTPERRVCRQSTFDPTSHPADEPVGPSSDGKSVLTRESLGTKTMDGLEVVGTRETRTISPGTFGNDKPVVVVKEIWHSPQLQFNLSVTRMDPRNGTQKLEVADLKLGEPGPEWFAMPDGFRLVTERTVMNRPAGPAELEPLLEKSITGMTPEQLATALQPVEVAIGKYATAHAEAAPKDRNDAYAGQVRMRLSSDLHMIQQPPPPPKAQLSESELRLNQVFHEVLDSPCLNKPEAGDPPNMPSGKEALSAEEQAWDGLRDAWTAFLADCRQICECRR